MTANASTEPTAVALWYRSERRRPWEHVATAPTLRELLKHIGAGGRRGGDWYPLDANKNPNGKGLRGPGLFDEPAEPGAEE